MYDRLNDGIMPSVPTVDDVKDTGGSAVADGAVYGLGMGLGTGLLGPIGTAAGGVVSGASVGGQKGETLATIAIGMAAKDIMSGGSGGSGAQSQRVM